MPGALCQRCARPHMCAHASEPPARLLGLSQRVGATLSAVSSAGRPPPSWLHALRALLLHLPRCPPGGLAGSSSCFLSPGCHLESSASPHGTARYLVSHCRRLMESRNRKRELGPSTGPQVALTAVGAHIGDTEAVDAGDSEAVAGARVCSAGISK